MLTSRVLGATAAHDPKRKFAATRKPLAYAFVAATSPTVAAERYLRSYAGDGEFLRHPGFREPSDTPLDRVNRMMREDGQHLWVYDEASLRLLLERSGFKTTVRQEFGRSLHPRMAEADAAERAFESLYVEAVG